MNIDLKKLLEKFSAFFGQKEEVKTRPIARPARDWKIMLACIALGILVGVFFGGYTYYVIHTDASTQTNAALRSKVKDTDIKSIFDAFEERARTHQGYTEGGGGVADPSR